LPQVGRHLRPSATKAAGPIGTQVFAHTGLRRPGRSPSCRRGSGNSSGSACSERLGLLIGDFPALALTGADQARARERSETRAASRTVFPLLTAELLTFWRDRMPSDARSLRRHDVRWAIIHWFELGTLALLCLNLWFVSTVLNALRETNRGAASRVPPTRRRSFPEGPSLGAPHADNPRLFLNGANSARALRGLRECDVPAVLDLRHRRLPSDRAFRVLCPQGARNAPGVRDPPPLGIGAVPEAAGQLQVFQG
jgi:hypothetical protein